MRIYERNYKTFSKEEIRIIQQKEKYFFQKKFYLKKISIKRIKF